MNRQLLVVLFTLALVSIMPGNGKAAQSGSGELNTIDQYDSGDPDGSYSNTSFSNSSDQTGSPYQPGSMIDRAFQLSPSAQAGLQADLWLALDRARMSDGSHQDLHTLLDDLTALSDNDMLAAQAGFHPSQTIMFDDLVRMMNGSLANLLTDKRRTKKAGNAYHSPVASLTALSDVGIKVDPTDGLMAVDPAAPPRMVREAQYWRQSFRGSVDTPGVGYGFAARLIHKGKAIGMDFPIAEDWTMVAMAARTKGRIYQLTADTNPVRERLKTRGFSMGLGVRHEDDHWRTGIASLFSINRIKGKRDGPLGSTLLQRRSRGHDIGLATDIGYRDRIGDYNLQTVGRVSYAHVVEQGYEETGGAAALVVGNAERKRVTSEVGFGLGRQFSLQQGHANWSVEAVWQRDWREQAGQAVSQLVLSGDRSVFSSDLTSGQDDLFAMAFARWDHARAFQSGIAYAQHVWQ